MFFKLLFKFIFITAIFMGIAIYGNYLSSGRLPPYLESFFNKIHSQSLSKPEFVKDLTDKAANILHGDNIQEKPPGYIYKWKDSQGQTHLTSTVPGGNIQFEKIKLQTNTNIVPGVSTSQVNESDSQDRTTAKADNSLSEMSLGDVYSPDKVKELHQGAEAIREQLNERIETQQQLLE